MFEDAAIEISEHMSWTSRAPASNAAVQRGEGIKDLTIMGPFTDAKSCKDGRRMKGPTATATASGGNETIISREKAEKQNTLGSGYKVLGYKVFSDIRSLKRPYFRNSRSFLLIYLGHFGK